MVEETVKTSEEIGTPVEPQVDLSQYVPIADFRKHQSITDRKLEEIRKEKEALAEQLESLISDPKARAEAKQQRLEAQLAVYKQREVLAEQRRLFAEQWEVPTEVLAKAEAPEDMTRAALDWLNAQRKQVQTPKKEEESPLADKVATGVGATPDFSKMSEGSFEKQIQDLRVVAKKGGRAGEAARLEILKLESHRGRSTQPRSRV